MPRTGIHGIHGILSTLGRGLLAPSLEPQGNSNLAPAFIYKSDHLPRAPLQQGGVPEQTGHIAGHTQACDTFNIGHRHETQHRSTTARVPEKEANRHSMLCTLGMAPACCDLYVGREDNSDDVR